MAASKRNTRKPRIGGVTAEDFNWGTIFKGSKEALQRAGLLPKKFRLNQSYDLPLPLYRSDRYNEPRRQASVSDWGDGNLHVHVQFDPVHDMAVRERTTAALRAFDGLRDVLQRARAGNKANFAAICLAEDVRDQIAAVPPRPLSAQIPEQIPEARGVVRDV